MINKIKENVWQLYFENFGSCVYVIKENNKIILIDTGSYETRDELLKDMDQLFISPENVNVIILTHYHYDHVGNVNLFKNAKVYGSKKDFSKNINDIKGLDLDYFKIIETPGHSKGSVCILYKDILFSGDTLFHCGIGRMDLPGGSEKDMQDSLNKLKKIKYKILCPGHL